MTPRSPAARSVLQVQAAWGVHLYTASGALVAFLSAMAVAESRYRAAFLWVFLATLIDATDGVLARAAHVKTRLPELDGGRLDDIVDYLTYVFVPVFLLSHARLLPERWGLGVAAAVLIASACGFSRTEAKTSDHFFSGFPSYWSITAFYLYALQFPAWVNGLLLLLLSGAVFLPVGYVYPSRTPELRGLTVGLGILWGASVLLLIWQLPDVSSTLLYGSLLYPAYYFTLSFILHRRRSPHL